MERRIQTHLFFVLWTCLFFLSGCGAYQVEEDTETTEVAGPYGMDVTLSNAQLFTSLYPLQLYLFDTKGETVWEEEIQSPTEWPSLSQPAGDYVLTVISGLSSEDYLPPMALNAKQVLAFSQGNCANTPLVIGKNVVKLKNDVKVSMSLSYAVAALYFSFGGVPDDAVAVEARISPVSSAMSLEGDWNNDGQFASVTCQKIKGIWKAGPIYVFPSESSQTHLSLNVKTASGETVYGYSFHYPLEAGKPYRFVSTGDGEVTLEGNEQIQGWMPEISVEFPFENMTPEEDWEKPQPDVPDDGGEDMDENEAENEGPGDDSADTPTGDDDSDGIIAETLPESGTIWGPFFVWKVEPLSENEVMATLVSPRQWLLKKAEARSVCEAYEVDGITGWRTFTTDEAKEFRDQYAGTMEELNEILQENGIDSFDKYDCRYLCNELNSTFCFYNNKVLNSGETVDYALRLVKEIRVKKAP